jgi:hypothetical protein
VDVSEQQLVLTVSNAARRETRAEMLRLAGIVRKSERVASGTLALHVVAELVMQHELATMSAAC